MNELPAMRGIVHGNSIQFENELGLPEGLPVSVVVQPIPNAPKDLEGLRRSFGAWADEAEELDKFLEWNRQRRKLSRQKDIE
jgi:hypothetical protein